jgi:recombination associated protein RdgC
MWFKNIFIYRLPKNWATEAPLLEDQLSRQPLQTCSASDAQSAGWVAPRESGSLVYPVNGQWLLSLGVEQKLLPASVVKQFANDKIKAIQETEDRRVGRKEMKEIREQMTFELLPRAFVRRRSTSGWIDPINGWLAIDAAAPAKAEEFLEHLRQSVDRLPAKLLKTEQSPSAAMTAWVASGEAPTGFSVDQDLELRSAEKATVRYAKHSLDGEEIRKHIAAGKVVTRLAMTWNDRISFVLNENLQIKRLSFLDILKENADHQAENADERFDLDFTLMAGELARLLDDLLEALGGELPQ